MAGAGQQSGVKHKVNLASLFPKIKICKLRCEFSSKGGCEETIDRDYIFVKQLEKEGRLEQMKTDLKKTTQLSFNDADMGIVTAKRKESINLKESKKWIEEVKHLVYTTNKVYFDVFQTGQLSEKILQELTSTYPEVKASCYLSNDKQSLLVTSSDGEEVQEIKRFVESRIPGTNTAQTTQPSAQPVKMSENKSPDTNTTTFSISAESKEESDEKSPVSKTSGDSTCSKRKDKADKKSPSMATAPMAHNECETTSPVNKTTGSSCCKSDDKLEEKLPKAEKVALSGSREVEDMSREKSSDIRPPDVLKCSTVERKSENKLPVSSQEVINALGEVDPSLQLHTQVSVATADGQTSARLDAELHPHGNTLATTSASEDVHPVAISDTNRDISSGIAAQASHQRTSAEPITSGGRLDHTSSQERALETSFDQSVDKDLKPTVTAPTDAPPPISTKKTIEVPEQFIKLLQAQQVRQDFLSELENSRVEIDEDSVTSGRIVITQGDCEEITKALHSVIDTLDLTDRMKEEDVMQALYSLRKQFPGQVELDKSNLRIIFHRKVKSEVKAAVDIAASRSVSIPLSLEEMNYIQYHLDSIRQSADTSDVRIGLQEGDGFKGVLVISPPLANIRAAESVVEEMKANLHHTQQNMEPSEVLFLSGVKGQIKVKELEMENSCQISVVCPGHQVLTRAESISGCRLLLCEGNMAASDCDVVVFPLTENQQEWPLSQRLILEKGLLASGTEPYKRFCGESPKSSSVRVQCQGYGAGQEVVMVSVQHDLTAVGGALRVVLTSSLASGASVALPVRTDAGLTPAYNLTMHLQTIDELDREVKGQEVSSATVVLYLENISDAERREAAKTVENVLKQPRWNVRTDFVAVYGEIDKSPPSLAISGLQEGVKQAFFELKNMRVSDKYKIHAHMIATDVSSNPVNFLSGSLGAGSTSKRCKDTNKGMENLSAQQKSIHNTDYLLKLEALQYLLGENFANITILDTEGKCAKIQVSSQSDKLMQEDMSINDIQWGAVLNAGRKIQSEGIKAFVKPLLSQGKVAILTLDQDAMMKAKRLITSETEKSRGTSFRSGEAGDQTNSPVKPVAEAGYGADYTTKSGIRVYVYKTDITKLVVDVIVNAANGRLMHGGGVAAAIARAAGRALDEEGVTFVDRFGPLEVSEVLPTTSGNLPCKTVFHAVGPCWYDYKSKVKCAEDLQLTVFNCLAKAHSLKFTSIAVSSISSAIFGVPEDVCAQMYLRAVQQFEGQYGGKTKVQHIHFVDVRDVMVRVIRDTFSHYWNSDTLSPSGAEGNTQNTSKREHNEASQDPHRRGFSNNQDPGRQKHYEDSQVPSIRDHEDIHDTGKNYKNIKSFSRQEYNYDSQTASRQESSIGSQEYSRDNMEYNRGNNGNSNQKHRNSQEHGGVSQEHGGVSQEHEKIFQKQNQGPRRPVSHTDVQESGRWEENPQQSTDPRGSARHETRGAQDRESGGNDQQTSHQRGGGRGGTDQGPKSNHQKHGKNKKKKH